jgi:DNA helicase HerA-like ATPase
VILVFSREIGRVVGVDSFRVIIELDNEIKGTQKSGYHDIYEIAKINSYVILPVGNEKIVALVTRVKTFEENEFERMAGEIKFPKSTRHLIATMIGTIVEETYIEGVYNYPILDNPVWYIIKGDLEKIFDDKKEETVDLEKDFYLPIGKASNFFDYNVKINPDKFFCKHSAILGNTGSGKSCTIASIIQTLFNYKYEGNKTLKNANIIILDTNGEYKKTFNKLENINTFNITEEGLKIPYWFMNYEDFEHIFEPSSGTQAPILKKGIAIAKEAKEYNDEQKIIPIPIFNKLMELLNNLEKNDKDLKLFLLNDLNNLINTIKENFSELENIKILLCELKRAKIEGCLREEYGIKGTIDYSVVSTSYNNLKNILDEYITQAEISSSQNIDIPKYFDFKELISIYLDEAIEDFSSNQNSKYKEFISSLKLRLSSFLSDERKSEPMMLGENEIDNALSLFLNYLLGNPLSGEDLFSKYKVKTIGDKHSDKSQITVIDLSLLPYELLETITGLIGRLILEFSQRINKVEEYKDKRGEMPIAIVLEEAQNYIPEINYNGKKSIAKKIFEKIAREGRKQGISLIISSQRPSELSKTILSQCNTFIVHRLQNPEDQKYIKQIVSSANSDLLNQLPILPQQHAIIMGEAVRSPIQLKINEIINKPDSSNPRYIENWLKDKSEIDIDTVVKHWIEK